MLDLYKVPYETLEVNPLTKKEFKAIGSDYRKVPVAMLGETQVRAGVWCGRGVQM